MRDNDKEKFVFELNEYPRYDFTIYGTIVYL